MGWTTMASAEHEPIYNGSLGADHPAGSRRMQSPCHGVRRAKPPKVERFGAFGRAIKSRLIRPPYTGKGAPSWIEWVQVPIHMHSLHPPKLLCRLNP